MNKVNCAIYVRKSTEKGLEQEFNSLHNQEEACKNYILSQAFNSWEYYKTYEDGGISGGTMKRPGLIEMLDEIKSGKIQTVVVYKVDRLSRSIFDFHNMMKEFEQYNCNFVSITQAFDTSNSMGKLTLNMLLSFAQFEREVSSERIRDKLAASKAKGMWIGGHPPLGYDLVDKKLIPNEEEVKQVNHIFEKYLELKSLRRLTEYVNENGIRAKSWKLKDGRIREGGKFNIHSLRNLLSNKTYLGKIEHKRLKEVYEGEHERIISKELFKKVQEAIDLYRTSYTTKRETIKPLLYQKLYSKEDVMFKKKSGSAHGREYCYYVIPGFYLGMQDVNDVVLEAMQNFLNADLKSYFDEYGIKMIKRIDFQKLKKNPEKLKEFIQRAVKKVIYVDQEIEVYMSKEVEDYKGFQSNGYYNDEVEEKDIQDTEGGLLIKQFFHIQYKNASNQYHAIDKKFMTQYEMNESLVRAVCIGWKYRKEYEKGKNINEIGKAMKVTNRTVYKYLNLAYLSPKIINDIFKYRVRENLSLDDLWKISSQLMDFKEQEKLFYN